MQIIRFIVPMFSSCMMALGSGAASGQDYPNKPIRIITSNAGGGSDFAARQIAQAISGPLGQQVIVDNRPSGVIPGQVASKAAPDGYTLLVGSNTLWIGSLLGSQPYDTLRDFLPITMTSKTPNILVVHPSVPVKSVKELIALAKIRPGELNYASVGTGGSSHLAAELFKHMAGVNIIRIPYKGSSVATTDLIGGQVQVMFPSAASVSGHVKSGKMKGLAVTSAEPSALYTNLPTVAASGLPGYEAVQMSGIFAPAKTPDEIVKRLSQEIGRFLNAPGTKERFLNSGVDVVTDSSPEHFAAKIRAEIAHLGKVIKDAGIKAE